MARASDKCPICGGGGWRVVEGADRSWAERCACWQRGDRNRRLERAGIPQGLRHCDLDSFETQHHPRLAHARAVAQDFVDTYPLTGPTGILLSGPAGSGKTHLVVAVVAALALSKGARTLFLDFRLLLKLIQESWNPVSETSEKQVLTPVLEADVLALDDLGAEKPSPWVRETVAYLINERYSRGRPVLITTNLAYGRVESGQEGARQEMARRVGREAARPAEFLEDRLGVPTLSRLSEMCKPVDLSGVEDYRRTKKVFGTDKFGLG